MQIIDKSTPEGVKRLWKNSNSEDREDYLFDAIIALKETFCKEFKTHMHTCQGKYITRTQAKWLVGIVLALAVGIALGTGYITAKEILSQGLKSMI